MRFALLSLVCCSVAFVSCDRHSWEDSTEIDETTGEPLAKGTHRLFLDHGGHDSHDAHGEHTKGDHGHGDHGKDHEGHGKGDHDHEGHDDHGKKAHDAKGGH